nr:MAG TPA: hypothetical protein [Bacteriophage sp.]
MKRKIDLESLPLKDWKKEATMFQDDYTAGVETSWLLNVAKAENKMIWKIIRAIEEAPTLTLPNEALTLEQLRKMDGEPAWWDDGEGSCWGIISVDSAGMWGGIPFFRGRWRQVNFEYNIEERKMRIYRRPPEGGEEP